tara:strand:+ start:1018 stop:1257 length:240 start_codon:yes stop_codon:yes gene_type:complete
MSHFGDLLKGKVTAPVVDEVPSKPEVVTVVETSNEGEVNFSGMSKKQLENYGRTVGIELDRRHSKSKLLKELKTHMDSL